MSELAKALLEYQAATGGLEADKESTHRNVPAYASIGAVINNVKEANKFGLTFTQEVDFEGDTMFVRTVMMHKSGEARMSRYPIFVDDKTNSQKIGGAITYAKRYALASIFGTEKGVEDTDDDGESNGLLHDAPKEVSSKPAVTTPVTVSLSDGAGHSREEGLKPASRAFSSIVESVQPPEDPLVAELAAIKKLDALKVLFNDMGGKKMSQDKQVIFSNRMKAIMQGANS